MPNALKTIVKFNKRKAILGAVFAIISLAVCSIWFSKTAGIAFAFLFLVVGCLKFTPEQAWCKYLLTSLWGLFSLFISYCIPTLMVGYGRFFDAGFMRILLNMLCAAFVAGILFLISADLRISIAAATVLLTGLATANCFVYQFRGKELALIDFLSIGTALNVADQYTPVITPTLFYGWALFVLVLFCGFSIPGCPKFPPVRSRLFALFFEVVIALTVYVGSSDISTKTWNVDGTALNGYYLNLCLGARDTVVKEPENYTQEALNGYEQEYLPAEGPSRQEELPNIIVVMNESFADFRVLGEVRTNEPVTPFIDSLEENVIRGYALASVYGGNTANSEYEFLAGHSTAFLPTGAVPYQQYISDKTYSLAWLMSSYGYQTLATHPFLENGWSRPLVYPYFGFSESTFVDDYPNENLIRDYVSDQEMAEYIIGKLADESSTEPMFIFGITMQNHGAYQYAGENFSNTISLTGYGQEYPEAEQYLSLLKETDRATEYLLTTLSEYPEDTIVLFFGDHFPRVEEAFFEELNGSSFDTLEEQMLQYRVPFFIWANFDIPEQTVECTSLNYLSRYLLECTGVELPPYYQFLADMEEEIPALNALGYYSKEQGKYIPLDEAAGDEADWLNRYAILQYNNLFDTENRSTVFFEQYIESVK